MEQDNRIAVTLIDNMKLDSHRAREYVHAVR
jgi:hypothetical protein